MKKILIKLYGEEELRQHIDRAILSFHHVDYKVREQMVDKAMRLITGEMTTKEVIEQIGI